jgi:hypothetical protein
VPAQPSPDNPPARQQGPNGNEISTGFIAAIIVGGLAAFVVTIAGLGALAWFWIASNKTQRPRKKNSKARRLDEEAPMTKPRKDGIKSKRG